MTSLERDPRAIVVSALFFALVAPGIVAPNNVKNMDLVIEIPAGVRLGFSSDPSTSMTVSWWTSSSKTDSRVYFGRSPGNLDLVATGTVSPVSTGYIHRVDMNGLHPGTMYYYKCGGGSGNSSIFNFTTAPKPRTASSVHFVAYGDTRSDYIRRNVTRRMIVEHDSDDFDTDSAIVLHAGDVVASGGSQSLYDRYSNDMEPLASTVPVMHVAGNHDASGIMTVYPSQFVEPTNGDDGWYYSFDWGPVHFVGLNAEDFAAGSNDPAFLEWLENDLRTARDDVNTLWTVAWFHQPLYVSFSHDARYDLWSTWNKLFTTYGVDITFSGHCHGYQRNYPINHNGLISMDGDPDYVNSPYPIHVVSGAGAVNEEGTIKSNLRENPYHARWENGDRVFFPSNHFSNVLVTVDKKTMTTVLEMKVTGLNYTAGNITESDYSVVNVDAMTITKSIPEGWFVNDKLVTTGTSVVVIGIILSTVAMVLWILHAKKKRRWKKKQGYVTIRFAPFKSSR